MVIYRKDLSEKENWFSHPLIWDDERRMTWWPKNVSSTRNEISARLSVYLKENKAWQEQSLDLDVESPEVVAFIENEIRMLREAVGLQVSCRERPFAEVACNECSAIELRPRRKRMHSSQYHGALPYGDGEDI